MTNTFDAALEAARTYRRLVARGDVVLADGAERDIDMLVGHWADHRTFVWPAPIADAAGVPMIRRQKAVR